MSQYALYTQYVAKTGKGPELVDKLKKLKDIVSTASGCRIYVINRHISDEDCIWLTEVWDSEEAHAISLALDGAKELVTEASSLLSLPAKQILLKALAGKGI